VKIQGIYKTFQNQEEFLKYIKMKNIMKMTILNFIKIVMIFKAYLKQDDKFSKNKK
jgi:hypothetical protein